MIGRLTTAIVIVLALNFLLVAGGVGYLAGTGKLDRDKIDAIREIVFPKPVEPVAVEEPKPQETGAVVKLDELINRNSGRPVSEQVEAIRSAFDAQQARLDRQSRELIDLRRQVELAQAQLARDRTALDEREKALVQRDSELNQRAVDAGFDASLALYNGMQTRQVKEIFATLDDAVVVRYLQAMDPRRAARILKEFKTPEETRRAQTLLERMRTHAATPEATAASE